MGEGDAVLSFIKHVSILTKMRQILVLLVVLALVPSIASAATIKGNVYDMSLSKASAIVSIDTVPKQQAVTADGGYSFEVPLGSYILSARTVSGPLSTANESIVVASEGTYNLDIILFPSFEEEESIIEEAESMDIPSDDAPADYSLLILAGIVVIIAALVFIGFSMRRMKPVQQKPLPADLDRMMRYIKKEGGRVSQKDLRKEFHLSEAKISLMVTELESLGLVKKIKKGRGKGVVTR
jgi:uncharacterized membrane protein